MASAIRYIRNDSASQGRQCSAPTAIHRQQERSECSPLVPAGLEVAMAIAGEPFYVEMPSVWGIRLTGRLPDWVSAKDVILEMLRRHKTDGGKGRIIEYSGPGLTCLSAMDRHVIANMGAELGATTSVFPSDLEVKRFLNSQWREKDWVEIIADPDANYDEVEEINLSELVPLISLPSSPDNVVPVREAAGKEIYQSM